MRRSATVLCALAVVTYPAIAQLTDGLVFYMPLDEGAGTTVSDISGNAFSGQVQGGATWVNGRYGAALQFAAAADHVQITDDSAFHITDAITQTAWINLDRLPSAHAVIFGTRNGSAGRLIGFGFGMNPANSIKVWTNGAAGGFLDVVDTSTVLDVGAWHFIAYSHTDDNNGRVNIYVDGALTHTQDSGNPVAPAQTPGDVFIGTWSGEAWPGMVDEVGLWNRALSDAEIAQVMELGSGVVVAVEPQGKLATAWAEVKRGR